MPCPVTQISPVLLLSRSPNLCFKLQGYMLCFLLYPLQPLSSEGKCRDPPSNLFLPIVFYESRKSLSSLVWWWKSTIPALGRWRQEDGSYCKDILGYIARSRQIRIKVWNPVPKAPKHSPLPFLIIWCSQQEWGTEESNWFLSPSANVTSWPSIPCPIFNIIYNLML